MGYRQKRKEKLVFDRMCFWMEAFNPMRWMLAVLILLGLGHSEVQARRTDGPRFPIERIRIEGARHVSPRIIVSEARLQEGRDYTERELRYAIERINRLPFILETEFSLEKGSLKGTFHLIIKVKEASLLFFSLETLFIGFDRTAPDIPDPNPRDAEFFGIPVEANTFNDLSLGLRWFIGPSGLLFAAVQPKLTWSGDAVERTAYSVGYSHYNLFGKNAFLNLTFSALEERFPLNPPNIEDTLQLAEIETPFRMVLNLSFPLRGNHWFKTVGTYSESKLKMDTAGIEALSGFNQIEGINKDWDLFWEYNSTNDNFLPTSGTFAQSGASYTDDRFDFSITRFGFNLTELFGKYKKYRAYDARHAYSYGTQVSLVRRQLQVVDIESNPPGTIEETTNTISGSIELGYSYDLWGRKKTTRFGDLRFEFNGLIGYLRDDNIFELQGQKEFTFNTNLTFRNRWGVAKLGFIFSDFQ